MRHVCIILLCTHWMSSLGPVRGETPATMPADPTLDFLLDQAEVSSTQPAPESSPTTAPATPLRNAAVAEGFREAVVTLSDGKSMNSSLGTTPNQPMRIFDVGRQEFIDVPFELIASLEAEVVWERDEREWHFVESGSDIREYTGHTYPAREIQYQLWTTTGKSHRGGISAPLYAQRGVGKAELLVLYKRQKGEVDTTLKHLIFVKRVEFLNPSTKPAVKP